MSAYEITLFVVAGVAALLVAYGVLDELAARRESRRIPLHSQENADERTTKLDYPDAAKLRASPRFKPLVDHELTSERGDGGRAQVLPKMCTCETDLRGCPLHNPAGS